jgi:putative ABC transport system permease protein
MGRPNAPLIGVDGIYEVIQRAFHLPASGWSRVAVSGVLLAVTAAALYWFLNTNFGITIRAVGSNERMIRSLSVDTDFTKIVAMALSNSLVALSGALAAQAQGFADVNMGVGALVAAFASVVVGRTLLRSRRLAVWIVAVAVGAVLYRMLLNFALRTGLRPDYFKLITALLVLAALGTPTLVASLRERQYLARLRLEDEARRAGARQLRPSAAQE